MERELVVIMIGIDAIGSVATTGEGIHDGLDWL
jgi:hypothetical protein